VSGGSKFNASLIGGDGAISVTDSSFNGQWLGFGQNSGGSGTIEKATMRISTGPLNGDGEIDLTGSYTMDSDKLQAALEVRLLGRSVWTDGSIATKTLSVGLSTAGATSERVKFYGESLTTSTVEDNSQEGGGPTTFVLFDANWKNSGTIKSSANYTLTASAQLTTNTFAAGDTGAGATLSVSSRSTLSVTSDLTAVSLTIAGGGKTKVGGKANLVGMAGSVSGKGSMLSVGGALQFALAGASPFLISDGGDVSANSVSAAFGGFSIQGHGARLDVENKLAVGSLQVGIGGSASADTMNLGSGILTANGGAVTARALLAATIDISAAGSVKVGAPLTIGSFANGYNVGTVEGGGSSLTVDGALTVGSGHDGALTISKSGAVSAKSVLIAGAQGGSILIENAKSTLSAGSGLTVGSTSGRGDALTVEDGGRATVDSYLTLYDGDRISLAQTGSVMIGGAAAVYDTVVIGSTGTFTEKSDNGAADAGVVSGSVADLGSLLLQTGSSLTITGFLRGSGDVTLAAKTELEIEGEASSRIAFNGQGSTLTLLKARSFSGRLRGFARSDAIDLGDIHYQKGKTTFVFTENAAKTEGVLKVSDGSQTATIDLLGHYVKSDFLLGHGLNGGTLVTDRG
jgi:T5SS/PEP-CTERM-associated repeat protein